MKQYDAKYNSRNERLRFDGFRVFSPNEDYIFWRAGRVFLSNVLNSSFNYSCLEAKFLNIDYREKGFIELCELNRSLALSTIADYIEEEDRKNGNTNGTPIFKEMSEEEMIAKIRLKYSTQKRLENIDRSQNRRKTE